jgi:hypothetical protein
MTKIEKLNLNIQTLRVAKDCMNGRIVSLKQEVAIHFRFMHDDSLSLERFKAASGELGEAIGALSHLETLIYQYTDKLEEEQNLMKESQG